LLIQTHKHETLGASRKRKLTPNHLQPTTICRAFQENSQVFSATFLSFSTAAAAVAPVSAAILLCLFTVAIPDPKMLTQKPAIWSVFPLFASKSRH
jgi:hypothetical protein